MGIPIEKARQQLSKTAEKMTDEEIERLENKMRILRNHVIYRFLEDVKIGKTKSRK